MPNRTFLPRIASRLLNTPLLITAKKLGEILWAVGPRIGIGGGMPVPSALTDFSRSERYRQYTGDGIGLIPVMGPLAYNLSIEDAMCSDIVSYHDIREQFRDALADEQITSILFAFDSPGGEVAGCFDLADDIYNARGAKPIYAVIDECACSGAYCLASAADYIYLPRTADAGSIGVIAQPFEQSKFDEQMGFKFSPVFAGARKNDFNPHFPISDEAKETLQEIVDTDYQIFVETVARNRGIPVDQVIATEAGIFQGEAAVKAGLADEIATFEQAVLAITAAGGESMKIFGKKKSTETAATAESGTPSASAGVEEQSMSEEEFKAALAAARAEGAAEGKAAAFAEASEIAGASLDAQKAETDRIAEIRKRCNGVRGIIPEGLAERLITEGVSIEALGERMANAIAEHSAKSVSTQEVNGHLVPIDMQGENPLIADAKKRASAHRKGGR